MKPRFTVIDLFSGSGGASLGLKLAGHDVVAAVDNDPVACKTYVENLGLEPICADVRTLDGHQILTLYGLAKGDIDLVVGCPPCQGFSSLRRTRYPKGEDSRNELISVFLRLIADIQPRAVVFENVSGIKIGHGQKYLNHFFEKMRKMGYQTCWEVVDAADYGVPQHRKRVMALSVKDADEPPHLPPKTHSKPEAATEDCAPWSTVRDAIGDLPPLASGETHPSIPSHAARHHTPRVQKLISMIPKNGGSRRSLPPDLWLQCHHKLKKTKMGGGAENVYGRMSWDKPSTTITCRCTSPSCGRFIHPEQDRAITIREAARLQTFPDDFIFPEISSSAEVLIGNAVPVSLMTTLTKDLEAIL